MSAYRFIHKRVGREEFVGWRFGLRYLNLDAHFL